MSTRWQLVRRVVSILARLRQLTTVGLLCLPSLAFAQGTPGDLVILQTSEGVFLVTEMRSLTWAPTDTPPMLYFSLGFSTDEAPSPGEFLDSLSVTLQTDNGDLTLLLLTIDAFGLVVAPPSPSAYPLDPNDVVSTPIEFPSIEPVLANQFAFEFSAALPEALLGRNTTLYFDLFNNQNSLQSLGWFSSEIRIPEPSAAALALLGVGVACLVRRFKK